jgi:hypothetical protein
MKYVLLDYGYVQSYAFGKSYGLLGSATVEIQATQTLIQHAFYEFLAYLLELLLIIKAILFKNQLVCHTNHIIRPV